MTSGQSSSGPIDLGGGTSATVVRAGAWQADAGALFGPVPRALWMRQAGQLLDADGRLPQAANCLFVQAANVRILVDAGPGARTGFGEGSGGSRAEGPSILEALGALGIEPDSIDIVIASNLRRLHVGGLLDPDGAPTFPRARLVVQASEWAAAASGNPRAVAAYDGDAVAHVRAACELATVVGEQEVAPGVTVMPVGGATAGHQVVVVRGAGPSARTLAVPGDLVMRTWNLNPRWISAFDDLPMDAVRAKAELFGHAAREDWLMLLAHEPGQAIGRVVADRDRYRLELT